ncbi:MAG TPA: sodium:proton antiporter [Pyrinomonadaceae bacterium]|nr:sodium:proton antiporter [Pyrinomonadaceae bacterium]
MGYTPPPLLILPFIALLALIALGPLLFPIWWGKHYPKAAFGLAAITLCYYLFFLPPTARETVQHTAFEYLGFIALIGSLYVVAGGIHINVKGEATPGKNVLFLAIGAIASNLLGTTGASMLMIRPWIRMNKYRVTAHHIVFFIFIVSNVGGCLTPIGDPPLFLGYLKGIPFFWVAEHCWPMWLVGTGLLLLMFYAVDRKNYVKAPRAVRAEAAEPPDVFRVQGLPNMLFLALVLLAVFLPPFIREGVMLIAALGSWFCTHEHIHKANHFDFHPIKEVAILFIGIFATMMPALDWLQRNAHAFGTPTPALYYWGTGILSSTLDNAPTYLSFLSAAFGSFVDDQAITQILHLVQSGSVDLSSASEQVRAAYGGLQKYYPAALAAKTVSREQVEMAFLLGNAGLNQYIVAISVGAVFFGANTYIGNGPNFMVKAIADQQKVHTPTFLGFIFRYTLPYMLPILLLIWLIFFRH